MKVNFIQPDQCNTSSGRRVMSFFGGFWFVFLSFHCESRSRGFSTTYWDQSWCSRFQFYLEGLVVRCWRLYCWATGALFLDCGYIAHRWQSNIRLIWHFPKPVGAVQWEAVPCLWGRRLSYRAPDSRRLWTSITWIKAITLNSSLKRLATGNPWVFVDGLEPYCWSPNILFPKGLGMFICVFCFGEVWLKSWWGWQPL
jgi:hypothetical protein